MEDKKELPGMLASTSQQIRDEATLDYLNRLIEAVTKFRDEPSHQTLGALNVSMSEYDLLLLKRVMEKESALAQSLARNEEAVIAELTNDPIPEMIARGELIPIAQLPTFVDETERYGYVKRVQKYNAHLTFNDVLARLPPPILRCPVTEASPGYRVLDTSKS